MITGKQLEIDKKTFSRKLEETLEIPKESIADHYKIGKVIGLGQYGTVKEAYSVHNPSERVAVKILDITGISRTFKAIC